MVRRFVAHYGVDLDEAEQLAARFSQGEFTLEDFLQTPVITSVAVSPDGKHVAWVRTARDLAVHALMAFEQQDRAIQTELDDQFRHANWSGPDKALAAEIALGVCRTADEALDLLIDFTERFPQGGRMGHRNRSFRYNSSFIVADPSSGWVLETAGQLWAAKRIRGVATISNALTIEDDFDRIHTGAYEVARKRGFGRRANRAMIGPLTRPFMPLKKVRLPRPPPDCTSRASCWSG